ncbi:hypothetical protein CEUSTIGMA_g12220.t1 [Chlamydomonas eustigma]|uniref:Uncharacterized protein n=1 Tax=Chlamydomonas eustigma TaxID=1157962 RepID=A0A250XPC8_9CHLO|nr:hypothetical protein CEUSTIGMA_g12220.t1 [Chlamydomonas eustigma]|eukprot:GAX84799.1 hypothetical protein CEUSTIGMA_g12220.t1 [Chlamydomonas eustigma]
MYVRALSWASDLRGCVLKPVDYLQVNLKRYIGWNWSLIDQTSANILSLLEGVPLKERNTRTASQAIALLTAAYNSIAVASSELSQYSEPPPNWQEFVDNRLTVTFILGFTSGLFLVMWSLVCLSAKFKNVCPARAFCCSAEG